MACAQGWWCVLVRLINLQRGADACELMCLGMSARQERDGLGVWPGGGAVGGCGVAAAFWAYECRGTACTDWLCPLCLVHLCRPTLVHASMSVLLQWQHSTR